MRTRNFTWKIGDIVRRRNLDVKTYYLVVDYVDQGGYFPGFRLQNLETNEVASYCVSLDHAGVWRKIA